ncbi:TetR family transcriptional regulator [Streptomyces candidus]|uniref:AcrR family transcriptional regulator n=1 Tax=Streptomyces candidus TaxID=67283 RepID=A0A7X0HAI9_9ACTN|nr:TetR family transcriptional regulator [Streptomyces candidus]MBB6433985.1 AcrR family transcriptional regulator [Streptomyces candidus]GHH33768.1 TetR family transcriptional regulator [Streptomyces candidus]
MADQRDAADPGKPRVRGLRERKKQRTRNALLRVALELFTTQGYERTTVDEIADAVDVSQRTFFRYFSSKEEVAFTVVSMAEARFLDAVRARPADEGPLTALRNAVILAWDSVGEAIEAVVPMELHMRTYRMIESTPALLAVHLRRSTEVEDALAAVVAEREGLDVDEDPRPRIAVAAFGGVMRLTGRMWGQREDASLPAIRELTVHCLDQLGPALAGNWRRPDGDHGGTTGSGSGVPDRGQSPPHLP